MSPALWPPLWKEGSVPATSLPLPHLAGFQCPCRCPGRPEAASCSEGEGTGKWPQAVLCADGVVAKGPQGPCWGSEGSGEASQVLRDTVTLLTIFRALAGMGWAEPWVAA